MKIKYYKYDYKRKLIKKTKATEEQDVEIEGFDYIASGVDLESRRIEYRGEVNELMSSIITRALLKLSEKSSDPIEFYFSSSGGDVYEGLAVYDAIMACPCDVHIIASGKIMSAGFIIFLAGDVRIAAPHTTFMMHSVSYDPGNGIVKSHEVQVNEGKRINNVFLDIMAARTNRNKKFWYRTILNQDKYLNLQDATEVGIIKLQQVKKPIKKAIKKNVKK